MAQRPFQTFDDTADPAQGAPRLAALRAELRRRKLDGFIVPHADEHQNEYTPPSAQRLQWLTGFTGSAGAAVVLMKKAAIFVDGRYTLQVRDQVDGESFAPIAIAAQSPQQWTKANAPKKARIGYDPWLTTQASFDAWERAARDAGFTLAPTRGNPIDAVWSDRPAPPCSAVVAHQPRYAGRAARDKLREIANALDVDALVLSDPHAIAWLFNIRGADVAHTPIALAFALVPKKGRASLFIAPEKLDAKIRATLKPVADIAAPDQLAPALTALGRAKKRVQFDAATAPVALIHALKEAGGAAHVAPDPVQARKAIKNAAERAGAHAAHLRDGVAMARFLCWFDEAAAHGALTEIDAVEALEAFRRDTGSLHDVSFPTISGAGPNGAIVHYRVTRKTNRRITRGLFLLDSGAQYRDGTTDITRTIAVGAPTREMKDRYTRVLKGHIAVATAVFPEGVHGGQLDPFARRALWAAGLDYDHGTGHGVGSFLSVHEGPQNIAKRPSTPLEEGMILSNEPGYYKAGAYGVRLENLVLVERRDVPGAERDCLGFETLTLAPFDLRLVDATLLTREELRWLDAYHTRVRKALSPHLSAPERRWLANATRTLARGRS